MRLDVYLADKKMVKSREKAHELIINGGVEKNGRICLSRLARCLLGGTALWCSIASFFAKVFSLNNPTTGEPSGFWRFQFQGI